jgi:hypothetical protein
MANNRSLEALSEFLEWVEAKGLLPTATVQGRKAAVNRVLSVLEASEANDVTSLDLDHVMDRFINLNSSGYTPDSLRTYRGRVGNAIKDFESYLDNPMGFRPARPTMRLKAPKAEKAGNAKQVSGSGRRNDLPPANPPPAAAMPRVNIIPIPIRADLVVHLEGVPFDLTPAEARRIANVVIALAISET